MNGVYIHNKGKIFQKFIDIFTIFDIFLKKLGSNKPIKIKYLSCI